MNILLFYIHVSLDICHHNNPWPGQYKYITLKS